MQDVSFHWYGTHRYHLHVQMEHVHCESWLERGQQGGYQQRTHFARIEGCDADSAEQEQQQFLEVVGNIYRAAGLDSHAPGLWRKTDG